MDRFEAKLNILLHRQDQHLIKVQALIDKHGMLDLNRARRFHDEQMDVLARSLLDAMNARGEGDTFAARLLCVIVDATCLKLKDHMHEIQDAVNAAWHVLSIIASEEYIRSFTLSGTDEAKFRLVAYALETIKAWLLVTELAIERHYETHMLARRVSKVLTKRMRHRPITGPDEG